MFALKKMLKCYNNFFKVDFISTELETFYVLDNMCILIDNFDGLKKTHMHERFVFYKNFSFSHEANYHTISLNVTI